MQDAVGFSIELELLLALAWDRWQLRQAEVAVAGPSAVVRTMAKREEKCSNVLRACVYTCLYICICMFAPACM